jgi:hypothetical protein
VREYLRTCLAQSLGEDRSVNDWGMKCYRTQLIPHTLTSTKKAKGTETAKKMLAELATHDFGTNRQNGLFCLMYLYSASLRSDHLEQAEKCH